VEPVVDTYRSFRYADRSSRFAGEEIMSGKRVRLPNVDVHMQEAEIAVTQTRAFQRLFNLKQLGLAYQVYPEATHTRAAHSIRCLYEASRILDALKIDQDRPEASQVRMAALLHDIGHLPFSHTLEDEHEILPKHDRPERLGRALARLKGELSPNHAKLVDAAMPILHAVAGDGVPQDWKSDVVGNTVCADLLAYIGTDPVWTGIEKRPGHYRIYEYFTVVQNRLCIRLTKGGLRTDIVSAIMDLLDMRYALTERVIVHHGKCTASGMLARAALICGLKEMPELLSMGDERFLAYLDELARGLPEGRAQAALRLLGGLASRRLYQRIFKVGREARDTWDRSRRANAFCEKWRSPQEAEALLEQVEDANEIPRGTLSMWCPEGRGGMKLVRALAVWDSAEGLKGPAPLRDDIVRNAFPTVGDRVRAIEEQYRDLWSYWIAIDREYAERAPAVISTLESEIGIGCDPLFAETYLPSHVPNFSATWERIQAVDRTLTRTLKPKVDFALANQAAADGKTHTDSASILAAAGAVIAKETKPRQRTGKPAAPGLFADAVTDMIQGDDDAKK
jgi:HD superfamily phosphohydrolase